MWDDRVAAQARDDLRSGAGRVRETNPVADRLIVALDVRDCVVARAVADRLRGIVSFYKIGMHLLFMPGANALVDGLVKEGNKIFLDYKMYDVARLVRAGISSIADRGIEITTVYGDAAMMRAAIDGRGRSKMKVFAVTVLTGIDDLSLVEMDYPGGIATLTASQAKEAAVCGCDGIIANAADGPDRLRLASGNPHFLVATPGIRLPGAASDDHRRLGTPSSAIRDGADYLIVGRPIVGYPDPDTRALAVIDDMARSGR